MTIMPLVVVRMNNHNNNNNTMDVLGNNNNNNNNDKMNDNSNTNKASIHTMTSSSSSRNDNHIDHEDDLHDRVMNTSNQAHPPKKHQTQQHQQADKPPISLSISVPTKTEPIISNMASQLQRLNTQTLQSTEGGGAVICLDRDDADEVSSLDSADSFADDSTSDDDDDDEYSEELSVVMDEQDHEVVAVVPNRRRRQPQHPQAPSRFGPSASALLGAPSPASAGRRSRAERLGITSGNSANVTPSSQRRVSSRVGRHQAPSRNYNRTWAGSSSHHRTTATSDPTTGSNNSNNINNNANMPQRQRTMEAGQRWQSTSNLQEQDQNRWGKVSSGNTRRGRRPRMSRLTNAEDDLGHCQSEHLPRRSQFLSLSPFTGRSTRRMSSSPCNSSTDRWKDSGASVKTSSSRWSASTNNDQHSTGTLGTDVVDQLSTVPRFPRRQKTGENLPPQQYVLRPHHNVDGHNSDANNNLSHSELTMSLSEHSHGLSVGAAAANNNENVLGSQSHHCHIGHPRRLSSSQKHKQRLSIPNRRTSFCKSQPTMDEAAKMAMAALQIYEDGNFDDDEDDDNSFCNCSQHEEEEEEVNLQHKELHDHEKNDDHTDPQQAPLMPRRHASITSVDGNISNNNFQPLKQKSLPNLVPLTDNINENANADHHGYDTFPTMPKRTITIQSNEGGNEMDGSGGGGGGQQPMRQKSMPNLYQHGKYATLYHPSNDDDADDDDDNDDNLMNDSEIALPGGKIASGQRLSQSPPAMPMRTLSLEGEEFPESPQSPMRQRSVPNLRHPKSRSFDLLDDSSSSQFMMDMSKSLHSPPGQHQLPPRPRPRGSPPPLTLLSQRPMGLKMPQRQQSADPSPTPTAPQLHASTMDASHSTTNKCHSNGSHSTRNNHSVDSEPHIPERQTSMNKAEAARIDVVVMRHPLMKNDLPKGSLPAAGLPRMPRRQRTCDTTDGSSSFRKNNEESEWRKNSSDTSEEKNSSEYLSPPQRSNVRREAPAASSSANSRCKMMPPLDTIHDNSHHSTLASHEDHEDVEEAYEDSEEKDQFYFEEDDLQPILPKRQGSVDSAHFEMLPSLQNSSNSLLMNGNSTKKLQSAYRRTMTDATSTTVATEGSNSLANQMSTSSFGLQHSHNQMSNSSFGQPNHN